MGSNEKQSWFSRLYSISSLDATFFQFLSKPSTMLQNTMPSHTPIYSTPYSSHIRKTPTIGKWVLGELRMNCSDNNIFIFSCRCYFPIPAQRMDSRILLWFVIQLNIENHVSNLLESRWRPLAQTLQTCILVLHVQDYIPKLAKRYFSDAWETPRLLVPSHVSRLVQTLKDQKLLFVDWILCRLAS